MDIARLQLEIDSRKAQQAKKDLEGLASAAEKTEAATDSLSQANQENENRYQAIARAALERKAALDAEVRSQIGAATETRKVTVEMREQVREYNRVASAEHQARLANERQAVAMKAAAEAADQNQASLQRLMNQIDPLQSKLNRLDEMERQLTQSFRQGVVDLDSYSTALAKIHGQRAEISGAQMKQVADGAGQAALSMESLGIHTATARYNMLMLGRAAATGDMRMASSSMLQLGTRTNLFGAAARAAINPVTLLTAAAAGLFLLYERGAQEIRGYNIELIETGHIAGITGEQMAVMAHRVGGQVGSIGAAREAILGLVQTGRVGAAELEAVSKSITSYAVATGRSVSDLVSEYEILTRDPVRGLLELNEKHNYVTQAALQHVKALQDQGRETDAVTAAFRTHSAMMDDRTPQIVANLNIIQSAWRSAKNEAAGYFAATARAVHHALGGSRSSDEIRADLDAALHERDRVLAGIGRGLDAPIKWIQERVLGKQGEQLIDPGELADWEGQIADLYKELDDAINRETAALIAGDQSKAREKGLAGELILDGWVDRSKSDLAKAKQIAETNQAAYDAILGYENDTTLGQSRREALIEGVLEKQRIALAEIERQFKPAQGSQADISGYRRMLQALTDDFRNANQILESERRAGLVDEESYWQRKIELIDQNERAQTGIMQVELARLSGMKNSAKQMADIEAQMAKASADAAKERTVASNEQLATYAKMTASVNAYAAALRQQVEAERLAGQMQIAGMGMGAGERELFNALSGVDAKFAYEQQKLAEQFSDASRRMSDTEYQHKLAELAHAHTAMRETVIQNYNDMREAESSWLLGAQEGINNYIDEASNAYQSMGDTVGNAFRGMEDALVQFTTKGKLDFKSLADSIIADMVRIAIQQSITGPLAGMLGGLFTGGGTSAIDTSYAPDVSSFYADGGYTGNIPVNQFAGFVHGQEGVLSAPEIRAIGGEAGFDALRRMIRGGGNAVGGMGGRPSLPPFPAMPGAGAQTAPMAFEVNITNKGGQQLGVESATPRFDGKKVILDVMLEDLQRNGPYVRQLKGVMA